MTAETLFDKVWNDHVIADLGENTALLGIDRLFLHEMSGSVAVRPRMCPDTTDTAPNSPIARAKARTPAERVFSTLNANSQLRIT